jgi:hypothetical protein
MENKTASREVKIRSMLLKGIGKTRIARILHCSRKAVEVVDKDTEHLPIDFQLQKIIVRIKKEGSRFYSGKANQHSM